MGKKGNGSDATTTRMVTLLERIADRLDSVEQELRGLRGEVREMDARIAGRFDNLICRL
jgi:hypothetical protein